MDTIVADLIFPESLRYVAGQLWLVDMYDGRVLSLSDGAPAVCLFKDDARLGGLAFDPSGGVLVVDKLKRKILRLADGQVSTFADLSALGTSPTNDMIGLPDGSMVVGEYGFDLEGGEKFRAGSLYLVSSSGEVSIATSGLYFPNGMTLSPCKTILYVAESYGRRITAFKLRLENGRYCLSEPFVFAHFENGSPDGLSIDRSGRVWAALVGECRIVRLTPGGEVDRSIALHPQPYDVEVGSDDATLYVGLSGAEAGDLLLSQIPRRGRVVQLQIDGR